MVKEAIARAGIEPADVDEVIMGTVLQAGLGQNPARQAALGAGVPPEVGCFTVNKVCGSGLKSVMLAANEIRLGEADVIVAGGMESMTNAPYLAPGVAAASGSATASSSTRWSTTASGTPTTTSTWATPAS